MSDEVLTLCEASKFLKLSKEGLRRAVKAGTVPGELISRRWRFSRAALLRYLSKSKEASECYTAEEKSGGFDLRRPTVVEFAEALKRRANAKPKNTKRN